jgi:hemerythrin-like domain-containing protein
MSSIKEYLTNDHKKCDNLFSQMEKKASYSLSETAEIAREFVTDMEHHFQLEERIVFPEFELKTGMLNGPTKIMRQEHMQMRNLMNQFFDAIEENNKDRFFSISETLMILLQQHNMKEEQMLYTMMQQQLNAESAQLVEKMDSLNTK